jgi:hypothetical protein
MFLAVGHDGLRVVSKDGFAWEQEKTGKEGETYRVCAYGAGRFVAAGGFGGENIFAVTKDGAAWETSRLDAKYVRYVRGLAFGNERFYGIGGDPATVGSSKPFVVTSSDGLQWSAFQDIGGKHIIRRLAFGPGVIVGVGDRGRRVVSMDAGKTWEDGPDARAIETLVDVAFGAGRFVGVGLNGLRMASDDGLKWIDRQTAEEGEHLNAILWTGKQFVAVGAGATWFSPDGRQWTRKQNRDAPTSCCFGAGVLVGCSWKGRLLTSRDGVAWQETHKNERHIEAVCHGVAPAA